MKQNDKKNRVIWKGRRKKTAGRILAGMLASLLLLTTAACGKGGSGESGTSEGSQMGGQGPETLQQYAVKELDVEMDESSFRTMKQVGDDLYYIVGSYDEEAHTGNYHICKYGVLDGDSEELPIVFTSSPQVFDIGEDGSVYAVVMYFSEEEGVRQQLEKYDAAGGQAYSTQVDEWTDTTKPDNKGYLVDLFSDGEGRAYLACQGSIFLFDGQGGFAGSVDIIEGNVENYSNGVWGLCRGKDGKVYTIAEDQGRSGAFLAEIDFAKKAANVLQENFTYGGRGVFGVGAKKDFLVSDGSVVYEYDLAAQAAEPVLAWSDCGVLGNQVDLAGVVSDGNILAVTSDFSAGTRNIQLLSRLSAEEMQERVELVLGSVSAVTELSNAVAEFNRKSLKYHISLKKYMEGDWSEEATADAIARLNLDLASGHGPDLVDLTYLNVDGLAAQGFLEDLTPWLEQGSVVNRDAFLDSMLEACTYDGVLAGLPKQFTLCAPVVRASDVGKESGGWTLEEFIALGEKYPDTQFYNWSGKNNLLGSGKANLLRLALSSSMDVFVDWETGTCSFDSPEFIKLLEFVDRQGDVTAPDSNAHEHDLARDRELLLIDAVIMTLDAMQEYDDAFEGEPCFIGYPTADGSPAYTLSINAFCGISATSEHKEGAYAFLESYVMNEEDTYYYAIPCVKRRLKEEIQKEWEKSNFDYQRDSHGNIMRDENGYPLLAYMTDENGELILDENGEPIPKRVTVTVVHGNGPGSWSYTYHPISADEEELLMEIIRGARGTEERDRKVLTIIQEEAKDFFYGNKTVKDVTDVIQSRVQIYLNENK